MLLKRIQRTIQDYRMFEPGTTVLVAVSGGVDSMVLLDALWRLHKDLAIDPIIAHLDHALRDRSAEDAAFVVARAAAYGVPCVARRVQDEEWDTVRRHGLEGAARVIRRNFLLNTAARHNAATIALGHSASDRAETVLYRIARGTGIAGIAAMPPVSEPFVRPLIGLSRGDVAAYADEHGLSWREDETNADRHRPRNRIRHEVLPQLHRINPEATDAVCRLADLAQDALAVEAALVDRLWAVARTSGEAARSADHSAETDVLSRKTTCSFSPAVQRILLRRAIARARGDLDGIDRAHVDDVQRILTSDREHDAVDLPGVRAVACGDELMFFAPPAPDVANAHLPATAQIGLGRAELSEWDITFDVSIHDAPLEPPYVDDPMVETIDASQIELPLTVRHRRPGDRFVPLGASGAMKLKDFLINEKVPVSLRDRLPLVCSGGQIVWVVGHRLSNDVRVRPSTKRVITIAVERMSR